MSNYPSAPLYGQYQNGRYQNGHFPPPPFPPPPGSYAMMPHLAQFQKDDSGNADARHQVSNSSPNANVVAFTANRFHAPLPHGNAPYIPPLPHTFYPYSPFQSGAPPLSYPPVPPIQNSPQHSRTPLEQSLTQNTPPVEDPSPPGQDIPMDVAVAKEMDQEMEDTSTEDLFAADREDGELSDSEGHNERKAPSQTRSPSQADFIRLTAKQAMMVKEKDTSSSKSRPPCLHLFHKPG